MSASASRIDQLYRRLLLTKFFTRGWGKPDNLKRLFAFRKILSNRETCQHLVSSNYPINIDKEYRDGEHRILEGHFLSPFVHQLPGIMPKEVETATFQAILPLQWRDPKLKPVCIHLAGTGDHYFWRRRIFTARPLLRESGIASILLENPYYGTRKPKQQLRSSLQNVSDLFVMGGALVLESLALLHWCEREGWGPLGLSGISMGGHMASGAATLWPKPISVIPILSWTTASIIFTQMASLAATNWTRPITLVPCLSWSTASCVFTQGVMSGAIPWKTLQEQFFENQVYQDEIRKLLISPEDNRKPYDMGQQFVKDYTEDIEKVVSIHKQHEQEMAHLAVPPAKPHHATSAAALALARRKLNEKLHVSQQTTGLSQHSSASDKDNNKKSADSKWDSNNNSYEYNANNSGINSSGSSDNKLSQGLIWDENNSSFQNNGNDSSSNAGYYGNDLRPGFSSEQESSPSLTKDEYISSLQSTESFSQETEITVAASSVGIPTVMSSNVIKSTTTKSTTSSTSKAKPSPAETPPLESVPSSIQKPSPLPSPPSSSPSSSAPSSSPSTDRQPKQKKLKKDIQPLTLSYAKTKQSQQKTVSVQSQSKTLSLRHAIAKSKLIISRTPTSTSSSSEEQKSLQHEALDFMRGVMDECTHLGNFSVPVDPELIIIVSAKQDAYVPKEGVLGLDELWPGCEVRYVDQGHVGAVLLHQSVFRKAVADAFDRQIKKYYQNPGSAPHEQHTLKSTS